MRHEGLDKKEILFAEVRRTVWSLKLEGADPRPLRGSTNSCGGGLSFLRKGREHSLAHD